MCESSLLVLDRLVLMDFYIMFIYYIHKCMCRKATMPAGFSVHVVCFGYSPTKLNSQNYSQNLMACISQKQSGKITIYKHF